MSRCFPFPPPGYEKKTILGDVDLLTKEKHREKKHKKDKKDKEKREGKERKKDKERSDGKDKEKKDRKEKHRDRKSKDRDKEKKRTLDEKIVGPSEGQNGEKLGSNCLQNGETTDSKFLQELGRRIGDEGGARKNQMFQSITVADQRRSKLPRRITESNIGDSTEGKEKYENKNDDRNADGQRNKIKARGVENPFVPDFSGMVQKRVEGVAGPVDKDIKKQEKKEKHEPVDKDVKKQEQKEKHEPVDKDIKKQEQKEKHNKHKDSDSRGDRQKDGDSEKKSKSKDKDRTKETEKKEKAKEKDPNLGQPISRDSSKNGIDSRNNKPSHLLKEGNKISAFNGNLGKRKELEMNGFLHDDEVRPNKLPRPTFSSHQLVQNGRKLEPCQIAVQVAYERQAAATNLKGEGKVSPHRQIKQNGRKLELNPSAIQSASEGPGAANSSKTDKGVRINGLIETQQLNACSSKPPPTAVPAKVKIEASAKLPHPDSKYLSQILSVPKVAEWCDSDDQEWLFSSSNLHAGKAKTDSFEVDGTPQVWAEALRIDSVDVTALPYVIPF